MKQTKITIRVFDEKRAALRQPLQVLDVFELDVPDTHDAARELVTKTVQTRTGRRVRSVAALTDGRFAAIIEPR